MAIIDLKKYSKQSDWSIDESRRLYQIPVWSEGYFDINADGHLVALPASSSMDAIDLYQLACKIKKEGQSFPVLLRFTDILQHRVTALCNAFHKSIKQFKFKGSYTAVYPIKVNQQRRVVEDIIRHGGDHIGLEAGSKPELLTIIALSLPGSVVICNGYKDQEYLRIALIGQQLGLRVYIVIEKLSELKRIINVANSMQVRPHLGIRVRLSSVAAGKWQNTGGEKSKFGVHSAQLIRVVEQLKSENMIDCLELLHFHIGSQVSNITHFQKALHEGTRFFAELHAMQAPVSIVDVGGGLGIDYEGSQSRNFCSINYTVQNYADTVINTFSNICREHKLPHPEIITESGRAMTAHHAMLITNVIDIEQAPGIVNPQPVHDHEPAIISDLWTILESLDNEERAVHAYYGAHYHYNEAKEMFIHGLLDLSHRARVEDLYFSICRRVQSLLTEDHQDVLNELNEILADKYFCNFSLFQSIPDSWAIDQIFPIVPLHHLEEQPTQYAIIQDLTCDSDGVINHYVNNDSITNSLPMHSPDGNDDYLIGIFLLGAYQEILGDMHNLFGDTASVNIELTENGQFQLTELHQGDSVTDLLNYVNIDAKTLENSYRNKIAEANLTPECQSAYLDELIQGLDGYTYLED